MTKDRALKIFTIVWMFWVLLLLGDIKEKLDVLENKINAVGNVLLQNGYIINDINDTVDSNYKMIEDLYFILN